MIIKCNIGGKWEDVILTVEEEKMVKEKTLQDNIEVCQEIENRVGKKLSEDMKAVIAIQATQHFIFRCENYAKLQMIKKLKAYE